MAREVRDLRAGPERELALGGVPVGDAAAALERRRRLPVGAKRPLDHGGRRRQGGLHVAVLEAAREQHVVRRLVVDERRGPARVGQQSTTAGSGSYSTRDARGRVLGHVPVGGDDGGHGLAGEADHGPREHGLLGLDVARQRRARPQPVAGDARRPRPVTTATTPAAVSAAAVSIRTQARVRVDAAHERHVEHPRQLDVAHVPAASAQEPPVLLPPNRRAEHHHAARRYGIA